MDPVLAVVIGLVAGLVLGGAGVWFLVGLSLRRELAESKGLVAAAQEEAKRAASEVSDGRALVSGLEAEKGQYVVRIEELKGELSETEAELERTRLALNSLREDNRGLEEREASFEKREAELKMAEERLKESFENLSSKALHQQMDLFLKQSDEVLKRYRESAEGDQKKSKDEIDKLLTPVRETLGKLEEHNRAIEKEREGAYRELHTQIEQLSGGTQRLIGALQGSASAGRFGEVVLQRVVELAGMTERVTYFTQESIQTEEGRHRPDMLVALPGGRTIIVDAKAPVHELDDVEARTPEEHRLISRTVAGKVLDYAKSLNRKDYARMEESPDFTVMFIASESAFRAACEGRPDLIEAAMNHNVVIATPSTLLALLRAVAYGWKQERLASEARDVQIQAKKLYDGLAVMMGHYSTLGKRIQDVGKAYNSFGGSLDRTVMPAARKFEDAGISSSKELPEAVAVEFEPRELRAQDFTPTLPIDDLETETEVLGS